MTKSMDHLRAASWTCPYCGDEQNIVQVSDCVRSAITSSLTGHVSCSGGDHGEWGTLPDEFDPKELDDFISIEDIHE